MESHKIPVIALLPEKSKGHLKNALTELCSAKTLDLLNEQLDTLAANLKNIRIFDEIRLITSRLNTVASYLNFAKTITEYAETQEIATPAVIKTRLKELTTKLSNLEAEKNNTERKSNTEEELNSIEASSPKIKNKLSSPRPLRHTRTISSLGRLIANLSKLDKGQKKLFERMAKTANTVIKNDFLLPVIEKQLNQLSRESVRGFCNADLNLRNAKTEQELDLCYAHLKEWLDENDVMVSAIRKSLALNRMIGYVVLADLVAAGKASHYKALEEEKDTIRKLLPSSELASPAINNIDRILGFQSNINRLYADRKEILCSQKNENHANRGHRRERSKSQGAMPIKNKITFFTSPLKNGTWEHAYPRSQSSSKLPTKWRRSSTNNRASLATPLAGKF